MKTICISCEICGVRAYGGSVVVEMPEKGLQRSGMFRIRIDQVSKSVCAILTEVYSAASRWAWRPGKPNHNAFIQALQRSRRGRISTPIGASTLQTHKKAGDLAQILQQKTPPQGNRQRIADFAASPRGATSGLSSSES
ncbi:MULTISPECIES: hypothetical protein [unclassified Bradyrhizobium]|uniref:hypothetical protein n=1 Tax=unclassified Bradyrhizobium TaxID=2631580 RepID=UPI002305D8E3|nr:MULTISPECIES: hypothetical protein [unclassified Bradyrhizobium]